MKKTLLLLTAVVAYLGASAQSTSKKPLDHSVYDGWQSVTAEAISNNAQWVLYAITPQEGDAELIVKNLKTDQRYAFPRIAPPDIRTPAAEFTNDSKFVVMTIKPFFKESREAKIKKKAATDMPKDTLAIFPLGGTLKKIPLVKSYKLPEKGGSLIAYLLEKAPSDSTRRRAAATGTTAAPARTGTPGAVPSGGRPAGRGASAEGDDLILANLALSTEKTFKNVTDYAFSGDGKTLLYVSAGSKTDSLSKPGVFLYNIALATTKKISSGKGSYKNFTFDELDAQLAFTADKSPEKAPVKIPKLYYYSTAKDSASVLIDEHTTGMPAKWSVSDARLQFSKDGKKLFFNTSPIPVPKDTTLVDFEVAKVDIWNYKDDYLQPMQLKTADRDAKRSYQAVVSLAEPGKLLQLTDEKLTDISLGQRGNADFALGSTDFGNRIESQWTGSSPRDLYLISTKDGSRKKIASGVRGSSSLSPSGNYIVMYNRLDRTWYSYSLKTGQQIALTKGMKEEFYDVLNDVPDEPASYGIAGFMEDDKGVLINDRYDIWKFDLVTGASQNITNGFGRKNSITLRVTPMKKRSPRGDDDGIKEKQLLYFDAFHTLTKENGFYKKQLGASGDPSLVVMGPYNYSAPIAAKDAQVFIYEKSNYALSPDLYVTTDFKKETRLSAINPQQSQYNWGTAELVKWTTPKGYASEGILYKPEDFDPTKKYPMIVYFYERLSDGLYSYIPPTPTASKINISFFVSNGYLVFAPDVAYETGHPGASAIEFINSGVDALKKNSWVDGSKVGIQGQSWGGYQVAYLITKTDMYAAAWAGAPVANMTSAYGGIRWETGMNRQFQYEKTQSRIGATLWEKPELYIENSPLFGLPNVKTPVAIMSNDADGAVPWYQGIEMFTGLRRLNKPVWLLNYNGEAHNLVQRQNKKDIQRRQLQFFDHFLKGKPAAEWIERGVPAIDKGRNWGFAEVTPPATAETGK